MENRADQVLRMDQQSIWLIVVCFIADMAVGFAALVRARPNNNISRKEYASACVVSGTVGVVVACFGIEMEQSPPLIFGTSLVLGGLSGLAIADILTKGAIKATRDYLGLGDKKKKDDDVE